MSVMLVHDQGIRRPACERCHRPKLACRRNNNNKICVRSLYIEATTGLAKADRAQAGKKGGVAHLIFLADYFA